MTPRKILIVLLIWFNVFNINAQDLKNVDPKQPLLEIKEMLIKEGYKILPDTLIDHYIEDQFRHVDEKYAFTIIPAIENTCRNMIVAEMIRPATSYSDEKKTIFFIFPYIYDDVLFTQRYLKKRNERADPSLFNLDKENKISFEDEYEKLSYYSRKFNLFVNTYQRICTTFCGFLIIYNNRRYDNMGAFWINKDFDIMILENGVLKMNSQYIRQDPFTNVGIDLLISFWAKGF